MVNSTCIVNGEDDMFGEDDHMTHHYNTTVYFKVSRSLARPDGMLSQALVMCLPQCIACVRSSAVLQTHCCVMTALDVDVDWLSVLQDLKEHQKSKEAEFARTRASVFQKLSVVELSIFILLGLWDKLADHYVDFSGGSH